MGTQLTLNKNETLQPGFQSRPATMDDLEATARAVEANFDYLFGTQAELLDNMRRRVARAGLQPGNRLHRSYVLNEKELRPGLDTHTQSLEDGGP